MPDVRKLIARALCHAEDGVCANPGCGESCGDAETALACYSASADAIIAALAEAGLVIVPRHMPSGMRDRMGKGTGLGCDIVHDIYDTAVAKLAATKATP